MEILRIATSGSVDDGKSTLIGRLLFDTNHVPKDKLEQIEKGSKKRGLNFTDLSLLTDGLISEREQGITIDVAHVYFSTAKRKCIIADTPGHEEYTRNMVTGASQSDVAIVLIDARKGVLNQTRRHLSIVGLLKMKAVIVAINKMDLVDYSQVRFEEIAFEVNELLPKIGVTSEVYFVPTSALSGEGVTAWSDKMPWFSGPSLLQLLDNVDIEKNEDDIPLFNVQTVIRPRSDDFHDYRAYAGYLLSGTLVKGQKVRVASTGQLATIQKIEKWGREMDSSAKDKALTIHLEESIDLSRGDLLVPINHDPNMKREFSARLCWMGQRQLFPNQKLIFQLGTFSTQVLTTQILSVVDLNTFTSGSTSVLSMNDIGHVRFRSAAAVPAEPYTGGSEQGGFILIDPSDNATVAAGFIN
jgi:sulfate adenylyltransferase subunit 1